ncbi:hypothetical protein HPB51_029189 [Rhipicephalus microplus]|uniref:Uncharacterized protein n=1 Tax=Rhipicephalus microplus TaxID=6941 RepID=A0A9J6CV82_RHIMP|nr:hypothetical protein HPB51_029189 [Rhipicephalus microplus]
MEEPLSRSGELSSRQRSMILDLDNAGPSENMREQAHTSSPLPSPDPNMPLLTTPEFEKLLLDFSAPETPPIPTALFQLTEEEEQWGTRLIDGLPEPNLPRPATNSTASRIPCFSKTCHAKRRRVWFARVDCDLNLDNAGRYRHISVQGHCSSLQAFTDVKMLQMTSPEREEIKKGFYVPESPPKPSTRLSRTGQVQQYPRCCIDVLPGPQLQQQQQIREQPSPVFQQLVLEGPNVSDSSASMSNPSSNLPTWFEHSALGDHVKDNSQTVPPLGNSPPLCYTISDEDSSNGDVAQQTTMHQELSRWEESRLSMRVMSVGLTTLGHPSTAASRLAGCAQCLDRVLSLHCRPSTVGTKRAPNWMLKGGGIELRKPSVASEGSTLIRF